MNSGLLDTPQACHPAQLPAIVEIVLLAWVFAVKQAGGSCRFWGGSPEKALLSWCLASISGLRLCSLDVLPPIFSQGPITIFSAQQA